MAKRVHIITIDLRRDLELVPTNEVLAIAADELPVGTEAGALTGLRHQFPCRQEDERTSVGGSQGILTALATAEAYGARVAERRGPEIGIENAVWDTIAAVGSARRILIHDSQLTAEPVA